MFDLFFDFLHNFKPQPIILRLGFFVIHWYGCLIVASITLGFFLVSKLTQRLSARSQGLVSDKKTEKQILTDMFFYLIIWSIIGARLYYVFFDLPYYLKHPLDIFKIWQGGLGIFGAIVAGVITLAFFSKKYKINFFLLADLLAPALALGQAIGRWGNYFNQEVFGLPTNLAWGIPIEISHRPAKFLEFEYFHPTFLYESLWNFFTFLLLLFLWRKFYFRNPNNHQSSLSFSSSLKGEPGNIFASYLIFYCFGRFFIEFLRVDSLPLLWGLKLGQIMALAGFLVGWGIIRCRAPKSHYH